MAEQKETVIIELKLEQDEARKEAERLTAVLDKQRKELAGVKAEYRKNGGDAKKYGKDVFALNQSIKKNSDALRQNTKEATAQNNSINALRASVSKLTAERNKLNTGTTEGAKRFKILTKEIKTQTDTLKDLEGQAGDFRRNVGDYTNSIIEASDQMNLFGVNLGGLKNGFNSFKAGIGGATFGLKGFKAALAATGIGLIIIAITSLISFFKKTERGAQSLRVIVAGLEAAFGTFTDVLVVVGETLFNAFKDPVQAAKDFGNVIKDFVLKQINLVIDGISGLGTAIGLLFSGEFTKAAEAAAKAGGKIFLGLNPVVALLLDGAEAAKEFAKEINNDVRAAISLERQLNNLIVAERALKLERAETNRLIKEQRFIAEDTTNAINDRITALKIASIAEESLLAQEIKNQQTRISIIEGQQALNENNEEDAEKLNDAKIALEELQTRSLEAQTTLRNQLRTLETEKQRKLFEEEQAMFKAAEDAEAERVKNRIKGEEKEAAALKKLRDKALDEDKKRLAKEVAAKKAAAQAEIAIASQTIALAQTFAKDNALLGKSLAVASATVDTYAAANTALAAFPPPYSFIAAGISVAAGLANVATIAAQDVSGEFAGGGSFLTSGESYIKVGDNPGGVERVTVEPLSGRGQTRINPKAGLQMAGGGSVIAAGSNIQSTNIQNESSQLSRFAESALSLANRPLQVAVTDIRKVGSRVDVRENRAKI